MRGGWRRAGRLGGRARRRIGCTGCLLWLLALVIVVLLLSLLFGGFQKGTKVGAGPARPIAAAGPGAAGPGMARERYQP
jgi:hypothetical protein